MCAAETVSFEGEDVARIVWPTDVLPSSRIIQYTGSSLVLIEIVSNKLRIISQS